MSAIVTKRNGGFSQMTMLTGPVARGRTHEERVATTITGTVLLLLWHVIQAFNQRPDTIAAALHSSAVAASVAPRSTARA